ncbi:MAG: hypothetical protein LUH36_09910 [Oscillospiraceae bacterium]|nr:hypothetical protein [Oscillospiraceae bacterium]
MSDDKKKAHANVAAFTWTVGYEENVLTFLAFHNENITNLRFCQPFFLLQKGVL